MLDGRGHLLVCVIGHSVCLIFLDESISSLSKFVPKFTKLGHVEGGQLCGQTCSCQVDKGQLSTNGVMQE
jgi:hypothetical protein